MLGKGEGLSSGKASAWGAMVLNLVATPCSSAALEGAVMVCLSVEATLLTMSSSQECDVALSIKSPLFASVCGQGTKPGSEPGRAMRRSR